MARRTGITRTLANIIDDIKDTLDSALDSISDFEHDTRDSLSKTIRPCNDRDRDTRRQGQSEDAAATPQFEATALWTRLGQIEELLRQQQPAAPAGAKTAGAAGRAAKSSS
ncbi:hypothetical protein [Streptomyces sp. WAC 06783]|uniref:hypothetical protein n=1 Tax=Streptomyces sp. WAC 06783 TaxID=2203211 RepID=UPI00163C9120|nr:hypothetical protein [Streptomyces sp. WAC 06783]